MYLLLTPLDLSCGWQDPKSSDRDRQRDAEIFQLLVHLPKATMVRAGAGQAKARTNKQNSGFLGW